MIPYLLIMAIIIFACHAHAEDVRVDGYAVEQFQRIGAWGWIVSVDNIISGPSDMAGNRTTVYLTSANPEEYPPGFIDPNIAPGDRVSVQGQLETIEPGEYDILLVGSKDYYIKPTSS